jgi:dTDP-4-dehydrorhamnose 3,5-epimerase
MRFLETGIVGAWVIDPSPHKDGRGHFMRAWCAQEFLDHGICFSPVQANMAFSLHKGTIRGMHYQDDTAPEAKLVRCTRGAIFDVAIDLRPNSATYGEWYGVELTSENGRMLLVPRGCAHGCETLEKNTELYYMASEYYAPNAAHGVRFDDPAFRIQWPVAVTTVSEQDRNWPLLRQEAVRPSGGLALTEP